MTRVVVDNGGTDWLTPLATLLAVLVGGWVNWWAQSKLADRRAAEEREAAKARWQLEAAAAAEQRTDERNAAAEERAAERELVADERAAEEAVANRVREAEEKAAARVIQGDLAMVASRLQHVVQMDQRWFEFFVLGSTTGTSTRRLWRGRSARRTGRRCRSRRWSCAHSRTACAGSSGRADLGKANGLCRTTARSLRGVYIRCGRTPPKPTRLGPVGQRRA
jgi:hypothetical protein